MTMSKNWLHYHPDGIIYIRDSNDAPIYQATLAEFILDYGVAFPPLHGGMAQLELFDGQVFLYDAKHNERDAFHVDPTPYQTVLDALDRLLSAKKARLESEAKRFAPAGMPTIPVVR